MINGSQWINHMGNWTSTQGHQDSSGTNLTHARFYGVLEAVKHPQTKARVFSVETVILAYWQNRASKVSIYNILQH